MKRVVTFCLSLFILSSVCHAQLPAPDQVFDPSIKSIQLFKAGDPFSYPVIRFNSQDKLELHFDDLSDRVKNYYYSFELCNADWSPSVQRQIEYVKGFPSVRLNTYRNSSVAFTRYMHYSASFPDNNSFPTRSGNYKLKVFLDNDTSRLVFTKAFFVYQDATQIAAQVVQPFSGQLYQTHQRLKVGITTAGLNSFSPQDIKVVLLQNYSWATARMINRPNIFRGNYLEYNDDAQTAFPAGKEWRWFDNRSMRLMSDRVESMKKGPQSTEVFLKPDAIRSGLVYIFYNDLDGRFTIETDQNLNPYWQGDYATVHFSFIPPGNQQIPGEDVLIFGELTQWSLNDSLRMEFNAEKGIYEKTMFLKQGYYNYKYVTIPAGGRPDTGTPDLNTLEGNYWGAENNYMIFVYYRSFGGRTDELIGFASLNSAFQQ